MPFLRRLSTPGYRFVLLTAFALAPVLPVAAATATPSVKVGDLAPDYLGQDADDREVRVSDFRGRVVLASFWATWCKPCLKELPLLDDAQRQAGERLVVVGINQDEGRREFRDIVRKLAKLDLKVRLTHDSADSVSRHYGVPAIPRLYVIDPAGKVVQIHLGFGDGVPEALAAKLNALFAQPAESKAGAEAGAVTPVPATGVEPAPTTR